MRFETKFFRIEAEEDIYLVARNKKMGDLEICRWLRPRSDKKAAQLATRILEILINMEY